MDEDSLLVTRQYEMSGEIPEMTIGDMKIWIKKGENTIVFKGGVLGDFNIIAGEEDAATWIRIKHQCILYDIDPQKILTKKEDGTPLEQEYWVEIKSDRRFYVTRLWNHPKHIRTNQNRFKFGDHWFNISMKGGKKLIWNSPYKNGVTLILTSPYSRKYWLKLKTRLNHFE